LKPEPSDFVSSMIGDWRRQRPDIDPSVLEIFARVNRLSALLIKRSEQWLTPLGLTWESFSLIVSLRRMGAPYELRPGELLSVSLLTSGAITNRIDRVEAQGLVERRRDPNDRRGVVVRLTPAGRKLADAAIALHFEQLRPLMSPLSPAEFKTAGALLARLLHSLELPAAEPDPEVPPEPRKRAAKSASGAKAALPPRKKESTR
jgi:DNA-binding MarR family transcriptional regulator